MNPLQIEGELDLLLSAILILPYFEKSLLASFKMKIVF